MTKGFYGGDLKKDNCTNEHIIPHSKGGSTSLKNIVLATYENNNARGNKPLCDFFNKEAFQNYCDEFKEIKIPYKKGKKIKIFDGNQYVSTLKQTVTKVLAKEKALDLLA